MASKMRDEIHGTAEEVVMAKLGEPLVKRGCLCWSCYQSKGSQEVPESLNRGRELLKKSLAEFREKHSKDDPELLTSRIFGEDANFETLQKAIKNAEEERMKRRKSITGMFHRFCDSLDSHSALMNLIPSQSMYCSLFCGAITCIVKASVNHQNITSGFSEALEEISDGFQPANEIADLYSNPRIQTVVGDLYGHYLSFLAKSLHWFNRKLWQSIVISMNQNSYEGMHQDVMRIERITRMMFQQAEISHFEIFRDEAISLHQEFEATRTEVREGVDKMIQAIKASNVAPFELLAEMNRNIETQNRQLAMNTLHIRELQQLLVWYRDKSNFPLRRKTLTESSVGMQGRVEEVPKQSDTSKEDSNYRDSVAGQNETNLERNEMPKTYTVVDVRNFAEPLLEHISNVRRFIRGINLDCSHDDIEVQMALSDWMASPLPVMWLSERIPQDIYPSPSSVKAASLIRLSLRLGIPILAFFCRYPYDYNPTDLNKGAEACLTDLVYNIIRQLVDLLPASFTTDIDLGKDRFKSLEGGGIRGLEAAFGLLADILTFAPSILFIVIDGIDHLDTNHVSLGVDYLLKVFLRGIKLFQMEGRGIIKVLFTTTRDSPPLQRLSWTNLGLMRRMTVTHIGGNAGRRVRTISDT